MGRTTTGVLFAAWLLAGAATAAPDWPPLEPGLLEETEGRVESDADVEIVRYRVSFGDGGPPVYERRLKFLTQRGADEFRRVVLPPSPMRDEPMAWARTVKPDGTVIELDREDFVLEDLAALGWARYQGRSFALPGLEPGAVADYRWVQEELDLGLQFPHPVREVVLEAHGQKSARVLNGLAQFEWMPGESGLIVTIEDVPAHRPEPFAPPPDMYLLRVSFGGGTADLSEFVRVLSRALFFDSLRGLLPHDGIRQAAAGLAAKDGDAEALGIAACEWVREEIEPDEKGRVRALEQSSAGRTFAGRSGDSIGQALLHAALLRTRGLDARLARVENRSRRRFRPQHPLRRDLGALMVAVKNGEDWHFFDPHRREMPCGLLPWEYEAAVALVADDGDGILTTTQVAPASKSARLLSGDFALAADGALEGHVSLRYTGHFADRLRRGVRSAVAAQAEEDGEGDERGEPKKPRNPLEEEAEEPPDAAEAREDFVRRQVRERFGDVPIDGLVFGGLDEPGGPVSASFDLSFDRYARTTRTRLLLRPAISVPGAESLFPSAERRLPVFFPHPWTEIDSIRIRLPEGHELSEAGTPLPMQLGELASLSTRYWHDPDAGELRVRRRFEFGTQDELLIPPEHHASLKAFFDGVRDSDAHVVVLVRSDEETP